MGCLGDPQFQYLRQVQPSPGGFQGLGSVPATFADRAHQGDLLSQAQVASQGTLPLAGGAAPSWPAQHEPLRGVSLVAGGAALGILGSQAGEDPQVVEQQPFWFLPQPSQHRHPLDAGPAHQAQRPPAPGLEAGQ